MMKRILMVFVLAAALSLSTGFTLAADQQEQIYGSQLMTQQERTEYRAKMGAAKTAEEREQVRKEHHEAMKERAKARGVTLPGEPPDRGGGMGPGGGMGWGWDGRRHGAWWGSRSLIWVTPNTALERDAVQRSAPELECSRFQLVIVNSWP